MKRANRLRKPAQFQRVRREGRSAKNHLLRLTIAPNRRNHSRCGIVCGKQIGNAVQRNRARRRLREAVRLALPAINRGRDMVFVIRTPEVATVAFPDLQTAVRQLLEHLGAWQADTPTHQQPPATRHHARRSRAETHAPD